MDAVAILSDEVRELIRRRGLDPARDGAGVRRLVEDAVADYDERSLRAALPPLPDAGHTVKQVLDEVAGLGPLQQYLDDPAVEEVWVNEPGKVFVARNGVNELTTTILSAVEVSDLVERMLKASGRRVDLSSPFVDATLADGSRLHVVIPDITRSHWALNVRKFTVRATHLDELVSLGTLTPAAAAFLSAAVVAGLNILVSGGTQAGKTTLLNCLAGGDPAAGARDHLRRGVRAEARPARRRRDAVPATQPGGNRRGAPAAAGHRGAADAAGSDRRRRGPPGREPGPAPGAELAGCPGCARIHANSAREAVVKMCTLPLLAGENVGARLRRADGRRLRRPRRPDRAGRRRAPPGAGDRGGAGAGGVAT